MPAPRVRATMFTRQGRRTDPHGHSHSVELHEAASPYRHPRYDGPSAKEKLIPLGPSAASGRSLLSECRGADGRWRPKAVITHDRSPAVPNYPCACAGTLMLPMTMRKATSAHMQ